MKDFNKVEDRLKQLSQEFSSCMVEQNKETDMNLIIKTLIGFLIIFIILVIVRFITF